MGRKFTRIALSVDAVNTINKIQELKPILRSPNQVIEKAVLFYFSYLKIGKPGPILRMKEALEELENVPSNPK